MPVVYDASYGNSVCMHTSKVAVTSPVMPPVLVNGIWKGVRGPGPSSLTVNVATEKLMNPFSSPVESTPGVHRAQNMATTPEANSKSFFESLYPHTYKRVDCHSSKS